MEWISREKFSVSDGLDFARTFFSLQWAGFHQTVFHQAMFHFNVAHWQGLRLDSSYWLGVSAVLQVNEGIQSVTNQGEGLVLLEQPAVPQEKPLATLSSSAWVSDGFTPTRQCTLWNPETETEMQWIRTLQYLSSTNTQPAIKTLHKLLAQEGQRESMKM